MYQSKGARQTEAQTARNFTAHAALQADLISTLGIDCKSEELPDLPPLHASARKERAQGGDGVAHGSGESLCQK